MKFIGLVLKSASRSKRRTPLTVMSVAIAVFLFSSLRAVLDGFNAGAEASSSTRIVTLRSTSLMFQMPTSHAESQKSTRGRRGCHVGELVRWDLQRSEEFLRTVRHRTPRSYLRMYPEIVLTPDEKKAFLDDRTGCIVGDGLAKIYGYKVGDKITLKVGIPTYGSRQDFDFRAVRFTTRAALQSTTSR